MGVHHHGRASRTLEIRCQTSKRREDGGMIHAIGEAGVGHFNGRNDTS